MGWASGSYIAEDIWGSIKDILPKDKKGDIAVKLYNIFTHHDADDWEFDYDNLYYNFLKFAREDEFKEYCEDYDISESED